MSQLHSSNHGEETLEEKVPAWQTGAANAERQRKNRAAKKHVRQQRDSKKIVDESEVKADAANDVKKEEEEEKKVVHPWHLSSVKHAWVDQWTVRVDDKDNGAGVYKVAQYADNLKGSGLYRTEVGVGIVSLPRVWGNKTYIKKACDPLVGEALGKRDLDLKYLVPRALVNLKTHINSWPGIELEIVEYLTSREFANLLTAHYERLLERTSELVLAKTYRFAASINATKREVLLAATLYNNPRWLMVETAMLCFFIFGLLAWSWCISYTAFITSVCVSVVVVALFRRRQGVTPNVLRILYELQKESFSVSYASLIEILSTCSKGIQLPRFLTNWKFTLSGGQQDLPCKEKQPYNTFGTFIRGANLVIPNGCHHDQYNGLAIRYFFERVVDNVAVGNLLNAAKRFSVTVFKPGKWVWYSMDDWLSHLPGKRATMLKEAIAAVNISDYTGVDIFVKLEAYLGKNPTNFKPRIIQGRNLAYQYLVGPFFYSLSKWLGSSLSFPGNFVYDSGLSADELGEVALAMFSQYKYVYEIDVSNWDGSLLPMWAKFETWFIDMICPYKPPRWGELKKEWTTVKGAGKHGVHYSTKHGRRSGDMWTSCFNSLINLIILFWIFGTDVLAVAKGDDNFFGTNSEMTVEEIVAQYASIGMKAKVKRVDHISKLGYCSGTFYPSGRGWKWGLKPFRIISKLGLNLHRHPPKVHKKLLYGTAVSMLPIAGHVPVLGSLLRAIVLDARFKQLDPIFPDNEPWKTTSDTIEEVHPSAYEFFSDQYQMSARDIADLELMVTRNLQENRLLTLEDFPITFNDPRFLRGFAIDVDLDEVSDCSNIHISAAAPRQDVGITLFVLNVLVLSPLLEEWVRSFALLPVTLLLGFLETWLSGHFLQFCVHLGLYAAHRKMGFLGAVLVHFLWNLTVLLSKGRRGVGYGSLSSLVLRRFETLPRRGTGLFSLISDRVVLANNRLTDKIPSIRAIWCQGSSVKEHTKNSNKKQKTKQQKSNSNSSKGSIGRSLLKSGLGALGGLMGPAGAGIGASLGDWGANILGMGDYEVKSNTLLEGNGVPKVHASRKGVTISHREFLGDITGSTGFSTRSYTLNPGSSNTFPWLSNIAAMFQSYRFKGLIFEFNSTSADALNSVNTALGTVIMATQYNVALPDFLNKAEMEQYEYTVSGRPSRNLTHCVECDPSLQVMDHLFTRTGVLPAGQDYQFYDWGKFQFATVGMQAAATIGELWVSYEVEFLKPRIASGGAWPGDFTRISNGPYAAATDVLGSIQTNPVGNLGVTITAGASGWQRITFPSSISSGRFLVQVIWRGSVAAAIAHPTRTYSNCTAQVNWALGTISENLIPVNGTSSTAYTQEYIVTINGYNANGSYIELGSAGTLPATPANVDIFVAALPLSDVSF